MVVKHTIYNLIGLGVPLIAAVLTIPVLINELGTERFGLLTLIWAVVSYFGLFDMGLGRALTQHLAILFAKKEHEDVGVVVITAIVLMALLGLFAGSVMVFMAPWAVGFIEDVPDKKETIYSIYAMSLAMPAIIMTSGFRGVLVAKHAFGIVNMIRLPMGLFTFLGPWAVVIYGQPKLDLIALVLVAGRIVACVIHGWFAWRVLPNNRGPLSVSIKHIKTLFISGGWMTVSNVISPFMGYVDRFLIGAIVSATAVAYYVTPYEIVTKLWIVPGALTAVLFPTFAAQVARCSEESWKLFNKAVYWLFILLLPISITLMFFAHDIMSLWISDEFASNSAILLQVFSVGIIFNCIAHVPFSLIQSAGQAKLTAITHIIELPIFIAILWWMTSSYGVMGAAMAWLLRMLVDSLVMFVLSAQLLGRPIKSLFTRNVMGITFLSGVAMLGVLFEPLFVRMVWAAVVSLVVVIIFIKSRIYKTV